VFRNLAEYHAFHENLFLDGPTRDSLVKACIPLSHRHRCNQLSKKKHLGETVHAFGVAEDTAYGSATLAKFCHLESEPMMILRGEIYSAVQSLSR
jgi:hypothetical protein